MRTTALLVMAVWAGLTILPGTAQEPALPSEAPFEAGETLRYAVSWRSFPAGHAQLRLSREDSPQQRWQVTAQAQSTGYVSNLYKVEDEFQSTFRNPSFCSAGIRKDIHEGDRHREVTIQFDAARQLALLEDRDKAADAPPKQERFPIPECVQDILSALYYARAQPLEIGQSFEFPLNDGQETIRIRAEVQALEEVQTEIGSFQAFRVEPDVFSGNLFSGKGRLFVWFAADAGRIPVQLRAQTGFGTIEASLTAVERWDSAP